MKLGEVYDVRDGTHDSPKYEKKGFALITSKNLKNDVLNYDNVNYISEQDYININKRSKVDKGDVLFAMIGTIGNPVVIKGVPDFAIKNVALFKIPKEQDSYFLKYYLDSSIVIDKMSKDAKGATQKFVGLGYLRNFPIPIPPLSEQKRIVAILDEAFAAIAKAKANAEKNLQNAKELFESYLQNVFAKPGKEWEDKCLGDVAYTNGRIGWKGLTAKEYTKEGPLFLSVHSLNYGDYVDFRDAFHISQARYEESPEIMLRKDDILICKDGAGIGKLGIVPELPDITTINSSLLLIRCKEEVLTKYLYYNLLSPVFQRIVQSRLMGATTPHLYQRDIVTFPILLPKLSVQKGIIQKLELLSGETKKLETIYQQKLNDLEELKKGILQKAFGGELAVDTPKLYATEHSVSSVAEEPVTAYKRANTNELNEDEWLQLYFMVFNIAFHNNKQEEAYLAEVKMEKSCHFGENVIKQLQFNRNAIKAMNGPAGIRCVYSMPRRCKLLGPHGQSWQQRWGSRSRARTWSTRGVTTTPQA